MCIKDTCVSKARANQKLKFKRATLITVAKRSCESDAGKQVGHYAISSRVVQISSQCLQSSCKYRQQSLRYASPARVCRRSRGTREQA